MNGGHFFVTSPGFKMNDDDVVVDEDEREIMEWRSKVIQHWIHTT